MPLVNSSQKTIIRKLEHGEISLIDALELLNNKEQQEERWLIEEEISQVEQVIAEIDQMIGLDNIKSKMKELTAFVAIQKERKRYELKTNPLVMHMIFKGNPGTGKTTVARIFAKLFKELGLLEKGHMTEVERADLVGEYIGHTAQKTRKVIKSALGGILFIDEAYSLVRGGEKDFGREAIDTIVKGMEDNKDNLIIILAGYPKEMELFLESNPGLKSRFPIQIPFQDYSIEELVKIAKFMLEERQYILSKKAEIKLYTVLNRVRKLSGIEEGNARTVRNIIEEAIRKQAVRLVEVNNFAKDDLMTISNHDLAQLDILNLE